MSKVLVLFGVVFGIDAYAWQASFKVDAATNNIPTAFSTAAGSQVLTGLTKPKELCVFNETAARIAINNQTYSGAAPSAATHYVPAGTSLCMKSNFGSRVYIRSDSGSALSTGIVTGHAD